MLNEPNSFDWGLEICKERLHQIRSARPGIIIGLCHGCFDLLHVGHLYHFRKAKDLCDFLVVSVTADNFVNKGPSRPIMNHNDRAFMIESLKYVDAVVISHFPSAKQVIETIKPEFFFKGADYKDALINPNSPVFVERAYVLKNRGKFVITDEPSMSTTGVVEKVLKAYGKDKSGC